MKVHLMINDDAKTVFCKCKSWHMKTTDDVREVTCKPCTELYEVQIGVRKFFFVRWRL